MPRFTGLLSIDNSGVSRLDGTRLVREPLTGNPFGRATNFLMAEPRRLRDGHRIRVDGRPDRIGNTPVIIVDDASRELPAFVTAGGTLKAGERATTKQGGAVARAGGKSVKGGAKKAGAKKGSAKKSGTKRSAAGKKGSTGKASAKKSGAGRGSAKSSAGKRSGR